MNRYVIRENIPWEGYNQWTVFAKTPEDAKALIQRDLGIYTGESLDVVSQRNAKGRKDEGIHKRTSKFEQ